MNTKQALKHVWTWRKHNAWAWGEAVGLTLLVLLFCYALSPSNPLFIKSYFPWPWLVSVIVVFQYGLGPSLLTVGIISIVAVLQKDIGVISIYDFQSYLLSGLTLILVCALFSSGWARRMMNAEVVQNYNEDRLKSLSRSYYMLRVSLDYLEQDIITKPMTLRLALKELQKINLEKEGRLSQEVAYAFLQLISQFCQVSAAGIYLYKDKDLNTQPFVQIGEMASLLKHDPLVKKCMELDHICYVSRNQIEDAYDCNYLVTVPLIGGGKEFTEKPLGILVIKEMPFWSLHEDVLRVLSILAYYFVTEVVLPPDIREFLSIYPDASADFAKQLATLIPLKRDMNIDSALVAVMVSKQLRSHQVIYHLKNQHRLLDSFWSLEMGDYDLLITLMPFTSAAGVEGYIARIRQYLTADLGLSFEKDQMKIRSMNLDERDPLAEMRYFLHFIEGQNIE